MDIISYILLIGICVMLIIAGVLAAILMGKSEKLEAASTSLDQLKSTFENLDKEAKEIIKTDIKINQAQEELDRRLNGLESLQKTSRLISTTLDENEIFHRLQHSLANNLSYEKKLIFLYDDNHNLQSRLNVGIQTEDVYFILTDINKNPDLVKTFQEGHTFSSATAPVQKQEMIKHIFTVEYFVIAPILNQNGLIGIIFVGNQSNAETITRADEEVISILASQIGQSLGNARLFEEVFKSTQILESKVQDRTIKLEQALKEVQDISLKKSEFVSAVSHELRTPLTSIKGYAEILMTGKLGEVPESVKNRLEKINTHSDNLVKLINNLLDIARIESGKAEMLFTKNEMAKIIEDVHDVLTPLMKTKDIDWYTEIDARIPELLLDKGQIDRVFTNLVSNAIKFTPEHGNITIKAKYDNAKQIIETEVVDTGIGMSNDDMKKLFTEFYRIDNKINQSVKGTGLGLSLVKKIIEAHHGKIWVTSQLNMGTSFHFTLPLDPHNIKHEETA
ncbi:MAG: hypothetical protein HQL26_02210 [Candidatus Omnitrophica bacterium]|nr:hypothetical protein [Candidatus Omnitrophota bacterium]